MKLNPINNSYNQIFNSYKKINKQNELSFCAKRTVTKEVKKTNPQKIGLIGGVTAFFASIINKLKTPKSKIEIQAEKEFKKAIEIKKIGEAKYKTFDKKTIDKILSGEQPDKTYKYNRSEYIYNQFEAKNSQEYITFNIDNNVLNLLDYKTAELFKYSNGKVSQYHKFENKYNIIDPRNRPYGIVFDNAGTPRSIRIYNENDEKIQTFLYDKNVKFLKTKSKK